MLDYETCYSEQNNQLLSEYQEMIGRLIPKVAQQFYETLLSEPESRNFLTEDLVSSRLLLAQKNWLRAILKPHNPKMKADFLALQKKVGEVHARIELPLNLMFSASRTLKKLFFQSLVVEIAPDLQAKYAELYLTVSDILDYAVSLINTAYFEQEHLISQSSEALVLNYANKELGYEIVLIKAKVYEWLLDTIFEYQHESGVDESILEEADFYLWIEHRLGLISDHFNGCHLVHEAKNELGNYLSQLSKENKIEFEDPEFRKRIKGLIKKLAFALQLLSDEVMGQNNNRDPLTALFNRRLLDAVLIKEHHSAREGKAFYAIMMVDIDHFKKINDTYGHGVGDIVLKEVASQISQATRITDIAFRYGGEEFLIVMPTSKQQKLDKVAEKIRQRIESHSIKVSSDLTIKVTVSIGIAYYDHHPDYMHTMKKADDALYQAKKAGRNRVVTYQEKTLK